MANNYWDRGRQEGYAKKDTLDIIEQLARIGGNLGATVKDIRDTRANRLQREMGHIIGQDGQNYKRLINNNDIDSEILGRFNELEDRIMNSDADTIDTYKIIKKDIQSHKVHNTKFIEDKKIVESLEKDFGDYIDSYVGTDFKKQGSIGKEGRATAVEDIKNLMEKYTEKKDGFINLFSDRVRLDSNLLSSMTSVENYANFALESILFGNNHIDQYEYEAIKKGLMFGDTTALLEYKQGQGAAKQSELGNLQDNMRSSLRDRQKVQAGIDFIFPAQYNIKEEMAPLQAEEIAQKAISHHDDIVAKGLNEKYITGIFDEYREFMIEQQPDFKNLSLADQWEHYKNNKLAQSGINNINKNLNDWEERHIKISGGTSYIGMTDLDNDIGQKGIPPVELRDDVSTYFKTLKMENTPYKLLNSVLSNQPNINSIPELYIAVQSAFSESSPKDKQALSHEWGAFYTELNRMIRENTQARKRDIKGVNELFGKDKVLRLK